MICTAHNLRVALSKRNYKPTPLRPEIQAKAASIRPLLSGVNDGLVQIELSQSH